MSSFIRSITVDCSHPTELAGFWAAALGYEVGDRDDLDEAAVVRPHDGVGPRLLFLKVPEGKTVKNRVHLDIRPRSGSMDDEVQRLEALGASLLRRFSESNDDVFVVMQDPEGNEFCVESPAI